MRLTSLSGGSMYTGGIPRYTAITRVSINKNMSTDTIHQGREIENIYQDFQGK